MKGIFAYRSLWFQLGVLLTFTLMCFIIASLLSASIMFGYGAAVGHINTNMNDMPVYLILIIQLISSLCLFLLPSLLTAYLCSEHPTHFLHTNIRPNWSSIGLVAVMTILLSPTISLFGYFNSEMQLPEALAPIERWMRESEDAAAVLTEKLLSNKGFIAFIANIVVIAITAAVCEEFFFRGTFMSILQKNIHNHHVIIWLVAIIFSAIHFQFYGFIPRMLLGAYLGYLLYWSRSIWVPVFAHFLNNALAVVGSSIDSLKDNVLFTNELQSADLLSLSVSAVIGLLLFAACVIALKKGNILKQRESADL